MADILPGKFQCDMCGGIFDEDADPNVPLAELRENFGDVPVSECAQVCDACYEQVKPANNLEQYAAWRAYEKQRSADECAQMLAYLRAVEDLIIYGDPDVRPVNLFGMPNA